MKSVLMRERDVERDPESKVKRREKGRTVPEIGPNGSKGSSFFYHGGPNSRNKKNQSKHRSDQYEVADKGERMWSQRYFGATSSLAGLSCKKIGACTHFQASGAENYF